MTRTRRLAITGAVAVAVAVILGRGLFGRDEPRTPPSEPQKTAESAPPRKAPPNPAQPQPAEAGNDPTQPNRVDPRKVKAALEEFNRVLGSISREDLEAEQERLRRSLEAMRGYEIGEPAQEIVLDEHGQQWLKLTYPSGEVRYEFPPAE